MATGLASLPNLQLRVIQETKVEQRLARLERLIAASDLLNTEDDAQGKKSVTHFEISRCSD